MQIRIAFNPQEESFEVANPAIQKNAAWLPDVAKVFDPATSVYQLVNGYCSANEGCSQDKVHRIIEKLRGIVYNHVGIIELAEDLDLSLIHISSKRRTSSTPTRWPKISPTSRTRIAWT